MSFSSKVKDEMAGIVPASRHCGIAETAAFIAASGNVSDGRLVFTGDSDSFKKKLFTLLKKTYNIEQYDESRGLPEDTAEEILGSVHYPEMKDGVVSGIILKQSCCRRSFLRGFFLAGGSMSDPAKGYHLEMVCVSEAQAQQLIGLLESDDIKARSMKRKGHYVVYFKESEAIAEFLNITGAHLCMMDLENLRIEKGLRSDVNRRVNCDTANINKSLAASARQVEDIVFLKQEIGLGRLPEKLKQIAELRLEYPELNLKELGEMLQPPVGKSGINHRLRKLQELAEELRKNPALRPEGQ